METLCAGCFAGLLTGAWGATAYRERRGHVLPAVGRTKRHSHLVKGRDGLPPLALDILVAAPPKRAPGPEEEPLIFYVLDPQPLLFGSAALFAFGQASYFANSNACPEAAFRRMYVVGVGHASEDFCLSETGFDAQALRQLRRRDFPPRNHASILPGREPNVHARYSAVVALQTLLLRPGAFTSLVLGSPLPKMSDSMQFDIRSVKDSSSSAATCIAESVDGSPEAKPGVRLKIAQEGKREAAPVSPPAENFIHGFEKTEGCQPSPLQTMCMQPGVVLECDGRKKYGPRPRRDRMAWKDYNGEGQVMFDVYWDMGDLYDQNAGTEVVTSTESPTAKELAAMVARPSTTNLEASQPCSDSAKARPASALQAELRAQLGRFEGLKRPASANLLGVRGESLFLNSKSAAAVVTAAVCWLGQGTRSGVPADSKVQGLKAPAALQQSSKQLADAPRPQRITRSASCSTGIAQVSVLRSQPRKPRQKVVLIGGRGLVVQPPLGATMGHGLLPNESNLREAVRKGEFYYPSPTSAKGEHQPRRTASVAVMGVHAGYGGLHPRAILGEVLKRQLINDKEARMTSHDLALAVCSLSEPASAGQLCTCSKALRRAIHKALKELKRERLYVVGGLDDSFTPLNAVERFDPADGSWESLPPINTARHGVCLAVVGGQLYVIGGELRGVALADVQRFNPWGIQKWEQLPPMSVGRIKAAAFECQGYLYVLGGHDGFNALCSVEQFHPRTQKWQEVTPMQKPRYACSATCAEGRIIVFGGELTEAGAAATFEVFDSKVGMWQLYPSVRSPLCGAVSIIGEAGEVYNFGGLGLSGQALTFAERAALNETAKPRLMFGKQTWTPLPPMPTARQQMSACMFQDLWVRDLTPMRQRVAVPTRFRVPLLSPRNIRGASAAGMAKSAEADVVGAPAIESGEASPKERFAVTTAKEVWEQRGLPPDSPLLPYMDDNQWLRAREPILRELVDQWLQDWELQIVGRLSWQLGIVLYFIVFFIFIFLAVLLELFLYPALFICKYLPSGQRGPCMKECDPGILGFVMFVGLGYEPSVFHYVSELLCKPEMAERMNRRARFRVSNARQDGAVVVGGKSITSQASSSVEFYSISGGWQELPPLPTARIRTAVISGHL
eukprot:s1459_g5.t1